VVDERGTVLRGREAYLVEYALVEESGEGVPVIVDGQDHYLRENGSALVISLEAVDIESDALLSEFERFRDSVEWVRE
jgi:hypothetical protein